MKVNGKYIKVENGVNHAWLYKVAKHIKNNDSWIWETEFKPGPYAYLHFVNHDGVTAIKWWTNVDR